jgi:hypothetical protein
MIVFVWFWPKNMKPLTLQKTSKFGKISLLFSLQSPLVSVSWCKIPLGGLKLSSFEQVHYVDGCMDVKVFIQKHSYTWFHLIKTKYLWDLLQKKPWTILWTPKISRQSYDIVVHTIWSYKKWSYKEPALRFWKK